MPGAPGLTRLVHRGNQAEEAGQLLRRDKTVDVANLRQDGQGGQDVYPKYAQKEMAAIEEELNHRAIALPGVEIGEAEAPDGIARQ